MIRLWAVCITMLVLLLMAPDASAQGVFDEQDTGEEVTLKVAKFGVGGAARRGDWVGIQVNLLDRGSTARDIILRVAIPDADGDSAQYDRIVTATPGEPLSYWLYAWLPFRDTGDGYEIRAYEASETAITESNPMGFRAGRLLGETRVQSLALDPSIAFCGVIGANKAGLDQYSVNVKGREWSPLAHELTLTPAGLTIDTLPDRWQGLMGFDTLVWTESTTQRTNPGRLTPEKARAIRNWIAYGGHLVIVLPPSGDPWFGSAHPLRTLMPEINRPTRREGVDLDEYRSFLTESSELPLPKNASVHTFVPADSAMPQEAMEILKGPDGGCFVIRRLIGSGAITVVGLDLTHGELRRLGLPDAESIWHRVLGMRGPLKRIDQMPEQEQNDAGTRSIRLFDTGIEGAIAKTGRAVQGVLFGLAVFVIYWVVAGPGGFFALRAKQKQHHAWVAFVAAIGIFTALSWMGATALRPKSKNISHLTLLEQIDGQPTARARSWMSVMLPSYGTSLVSLEDPDASTLTGSADTGGRLLSPWASPATSGGLTQGYPDNTGYRIEARDPGGVRVPTRATVKDFRADWQGATDWSMPRVVSAVGDMDDPALSIEGIVVNGLVRHELPGALTDVRVIVINQQNRILPPGQPLDKRSISRVSVYAPQFLDDEWLPGTDMNLQEVTASVRTNKNVVRDSFFRTAVRLGEDASGFDVYKGAPLIDRLIAGRMLSQFEPPNFGVEDDPVGDRVAQRRLTHGWDLGRWFTQPCVIVMGVVKIEKADAAIDGMPVPVYIDGKRVDATGTTIVSWIYPLPTNPPIPYGSMDPDTDINETVPSDPSE